MVDLAVLTSGRKDEMDEMFDVKIVVKQESRFPFTPLYPIEMKVACITLTQNKKNNL